MTEMKVPGDVEIYYPAEELKELKRCLALQGFLKLAVTNTGVSEPTIRKYAKTKASACKGQSDKINAIRSFVKMFNQQASQPA